MDGSMRPLDLVQECSFKMPPMLPPYETEVARHSSKLKVVTLLSLCFMLSLMFLTLACAARVIAVGVCVRVCVCVCASVHRFSR